MSHQNEYLEAILEAERKYKKQVEESIKSKLLIYHYIISNKINIIY